jgi:chondroitin AC lyase
VYDWQKISGTTIMQKPELHGVDKIQLDGLTDFVGAVTDGLYGCVAFDFQSPHDLLKAKKSWFFFDQEYVCLGADINSRPNLPVVTTVNQALLRGDVTVMERGEVKKLSAGNRGLTEVSWVYHDKVGYIFPESVAIEVANQVKEGRWSDITDQKNISTEIVRMEVFSLLINHGKSPDSASYQYIVVPSVAEQELAATADKNRNIEVLSNNPRIQAVRNNTLGISQIAFYRAGEVEIKKGLKLRMDSPGMAMLRMEGEQVKELTVSDPSRKLSRVMVTLSGNYDARTEHFFTLSDPDDDNTLIIVDLPQGVYAGKSVSIQLH